MTAIAIQKYIAQKISEIDDDLILRQIKNLIDSRPTIVYELSNVQLNLLKESKKQYLNGDYIDDFELDKRVEEWQKGK